MFDSEGWAVNYQMQIVTKLPNENIQNYQLEMFSGRGGGNYQMQIVTKLPNENIQNYQLEMFKSDGGGGVQWITKRKLWPNYQMKISKTTN